jgi:hypothetical protein
MLEQTSVIDFYGVNKNIQIEVPIWRLCCGFPREKNLANLRKDGLAFLGYNISYPITLFLLFLLTILNQT